MDSNTANGQISKKSSSDKSTGFFGALAGIAKKAWRQINNFTLRRRVQTLIDNYLTAEFIYYVHMYSNEVDTQEKIVEAINKDFEEYRETIIKQLKIEKYDELSIQQNIPYQTHNTQYPIPNTKTNQNSKLPRKNSCDYLSRTKNSLLEKKLNLYNKKGVSFVAQQIKTLKKIKKQKNSNSDQTIYRAIVTLEQINENDNILKLWNQQNPYVKNMLTDVEEAIITDKELQKKYKCTPKHFIDYLCEQPPLRENKDICGTDLICKELYYRFYNDKEVQRRIQYGILLAYCFYNTKNYYCRKIKDKFNYCFKRLCSQLEEAKKFIEKKLKKHSQSPNESGKNILKYFNRYFNSPASLADLFKEIDEENGENYMSLYFSYARLLAPSVTPPEDISNEPNDPIRVIKKKLRENASILDNGNKKVSQISKEIYNVFNSPCFIEQNPPPPIEEKILEFIPSEYPQAESWDSEKETSYPPLKQAKFKDTDITDRPLTPEEWKERNKYKI